MLGGLTLVSFLDAKCGELSYDVPVWKKVLRVVIGVVIAYALKELLKLVNVFDVTQISLLIDALRYFVVVVAVGFLCPAIYKKANI